MPIVLQDNQPDYIISFVKRFIKDSLRGLPITFLSFGLARLAAGEALREAFARIAPAVFSPYPPDFAIFFCTALNDMVMKNNE